MWRLEQTVITIIRGAAANPVLTGCMEDTENVFCSFDMCISAGVYNLDQTLQGVWSWGRLRTFLTQAPSCCADGFALSQLGAPLSVPSTVIPHSTPPCILALPSCCRSSHDPQFWHLFLCTRSPPSRIIRHFRIGTTSLYFTVNRLCPACTLIGAECTGLCSQCCPVEQPASTPRTDSR